MRAIRAGIVGAVLGAVLLLPTPVRAGGAMWDFNGRSHYEIAFSPGDVVEASTGVWISGPGLGHPDDGPFYGYLWKAREAAFPPPMPEDAMFLGEIAIDPHEPDASHSVARLTFTVPDVEPGRYWLLHCNDPCTTALGDIMDTPIDIVGGPGEEKLLVDLGRLERRFEQRSFILGRSLKRLRAEVAGEISGLNGRIDELEARLAVVEKEAAADTGADSDVLEGGLAAGVVILLFSGFHLMVARRKT